MKPRKASPTKSARSKPVVADLDLPTTAIEHSIFKHADAVLFCIAVEPRSVFRVVSVNQAFYKVTGFKRAQVLGKTVEEVAPKSSLELVLKNYRRAVRTKKPIKWISHSQYASGEKHAEVSITPVLGAKGRVKHLVGVAHDITARKQAEEALRASEERYARATRGTHDGLWDWNILTGEDYFSPRWQELLGYPSGGQPHHEDTFFKRVHPDDVPPLSRALEAHLKKRQPYDVEARLRVRDGSFRWFRCRGEAVRDAQGRPTRMAGSITDISAQKQAEIALRESEERYRLLADHMEDFVSLNDTKGNRLYISPSFFRKTGWTDETLRRADWRTRMHPDDLPAVQRAHKANLAGKPTTLDHRIRCRDGSWLWVETHCKPIRDDGGKVWRLLVTSHDITARKAAEEQYRREQDFNLALAEHPSMLIMVLDSRGSIRQISQSAALGLGFKREEMEGRSPWELGLMDEEEAKQSQKRFRKLLRGGSIAPVNVRLRTKEGEWRDVELRTTTTNHADGSVDRLIIVATDLTERLRMQQEVLRISEQEHARIGSDLHDGVGQTLTGVASLLDALELDLQGDAKQSAARIRELMQQAILDVRRMSHGLSPSAVKHRELGGALRLLADTVRSNFRTDCECDIATNIRVTNAEKQMHLFRIAQEAVNNAIRHGRPTLIKLGLRSHGKHECELSIEDNGRGMPKDGSGSDGIGLRVMDYRANLIGGRLHVQNLSQGGVRVACRFPQK